ncbi:Ltp family lipoprotein [Streptococcus pneumoniae]|nr:N-acetylmuramoyl-L-alanine amidase family protein [Streptococcus pneumoniae]
MSTIDTSGVLPFSAQTVQADTQTLTPMAKYYIILPKDAEIYKTWRGTVNIPIIDATKTTPELSYFKEDHRNYIANENKSGANYIEWKGTVEEFKEAIKKLTDKKSTTATPKPDEKPKPTPTVQSGWVGSSYYQDGKKVISKWIFDKKYNSYFYLDASGNYVQNAWVGNYYLKSGGYMAKGEWVYDTNYGSYYYLTSEGSYARNTWSGNYYLKSNGKMAKGEWVYDATYQAWYYLTSDGSYAYSTWQGNYYLKSDGKMAVNEWVDGGRYYVGADGVWKEGQASTASSSNDSNSEYSAALGKAKSYNSLFHMSKKRMYRQLTSDFDKFSNDAAQYAIDHLDD